LGEITALAAAGSIDFASGLRLVRRRGELMQKAGTLAPGGMSAILGLETNAVVALCAEAQNSSGAPVQLANDNCPGQLVISGDEQALALAEQLAQAAGARKVVRLPVTIAAHSPLMGSVSAEYAAFIDTLPINQPTIPVVSNITAEPIPSPRMVRQELRKQLTEPVRWTESMRYLRGRGVDTFIETGPGDVLTKLMRRIDRSATRQTFALTT
jgi:[acyl-carrier-protein] S-malonyltransferase